MSPLTNLKCKSSYSKSIYISKLTGVVVTSNSIFTSFGSAIVIIAFNYYTILGLESRLGNRIDGLGKRMNEQFDEIHGEMQFVNERCTYWRGYCDGVLQFLKMTEKGPS